MDTIEEQKRIHIAAGVISALVIACLLAIVVMGATGCATNRMKSQIVKADGSTETYDNLTMITAGAKVDQGQFSARVGTSAAGAMTITHGVDAQGVQTPDIGSQILDAVKVGLTLQSQQAAVEAAQPRPDRLKEVLDYLRSIGMTATPLPAK